jgi:hypothetical protein
MKLTVEKYPGVYRLVLNGGPLSTTIGLGGLSEKGGVFRSFTYDRSQWAHEGTYSECLTALLEKIRDDFNDAVAATQNEVTEE